MRLRLTVPVSTPIISVAEAKTQCRVLHDDEDQYFVDLVDAAAAYISRITGKSLGQETWELCLDGFPPERIAIPKGPLISVDEISYVDPDEASATIASFRAFGVGSDDGFVLPAPDTSWPSTNDEPESVTVTFKSGYATAPAPLKHACLLLISHWYETRSAAMDESMSEPPMAVTALVSPFRNWTAT